MVGQRRHLSDQPSQHRGHAERGSEQHRQRTPAPAGQPFVELVRLGLGEHGGGQRIQPFGLRLVADDHDHLASRVADNGQVGADVTANNLQGIPPVLDSAAWFAGQQAHNKRRP